MADDGIEVVELRRPAELGANARRIRYDRHRVAGTARRKPYGKITAAHSLHGLDHFEHRIAVPIAAIECLARPAAAQMRKRRDMRAREIGDMNVVTDAGAVRRRIVGAEDLDLRPQPE